LINPRRTGRRAAGCALAALVAVGVNLPARAQVFGAAMAETLAPWLADWIVQSRDAAIAQGVQEMPTAVRALFSGYVPDEILDKVRWRAGGAGEFTVQQRVFQIEDTPAVTLDYVIVFNNEELADDPKLWAHEIRHVMQYADWGVNEFALRYLQDHSAIENDAVEFRWQWMKAKGLTPAPAAPQ
jgi:hypothetical protein